MLEIADRLILASALTIQDPRNSWSTSNDVRLWCEDQRWGKNLFSQKSPVSKRNLDRLMSAIATLIAGV